MKKAVNSSIVGDAEGVHYLKTQKVQIVRHTSGFEYDEMLEDIQEGNESISSHNITEEEKDGEEVGNGRVEDSDDSYEFLLSERSSDSEAGGQIPF